MLTGVGVRIVGHTVDEEAQRGVLPVVQAGDLDHGARPTLPVARDLDLGALVVELGVAALGTVQGDVLDPHEVLARGRVAG